MFMTKAPEVIDPEKAPALAALQDLAYQEETPQGLSSAASSEMHQHARMHMHTPTGRARAYKEDGNEHFRKKKYKKAVASYGAGIKEKCSDAALNAVLYCNRAAAHYHLGQGLSLPQLHLCLIWCVLHAGNYRSSLMDATHAKKSKPDHMKAIVRGIYLQALYADAAIRVGYPRGCISLPRGNGSHKAEEVWGSCGVV